MAEDRSATALYDIAIIGGGINGCGIARDAAGRGYSVFLAEKDDLGSGTSAASTKLIHGGLRYLEHYEFRLVREALIEREVLWAAAPHIVWPLRFVLPHHKGLRPAWLLRLGLFLYDHLGGRRLLPPTRTLDLQNDPAGAPLKEEFRKGFEYSDCWVEDSRMVVLNARDARARGADIVTRTRVTDVRRDGDAWALSYRGEGDGGAGEVRARALVNAAGPWVDDVLRETLGQNAAHHVRLVKGSHLVVDRLFDHDRCYIFQNTDGRIVFAIPYEGRFTLIGTTDEDYEGDPGKAAITPQETNYLLQAVSAYFRAPVTADRIRWSYSGVRPLFDDGEEKAQEATRDYILRREGSLINLFGGKVTTFRRLAEEAVDEIGKAIGVRGDSWTAGTKLPGGDFPVTGFETLVAELAGRYQFLDPELVRRLARAYGTDTAMILGDAAGLQDLGRDFGAGLFEVELDFLMHEEWALTAADVVWRRSKLGLRLSEEQIAALDNWMSAAHGSSMAKDALADAAPALGSEASGEEVVGPKHFQ